MNETIAIYNGINPAALPWIIGGILAGGLVCIYLLSWAIQWSWAWVDDSKEGARNKVIDYIMLTVRGFSVRDCDTFPYRSKNNELADGSGTFIIGMVMLFLSPAAIVYLWQLVLFVISGIAVAHLIRFTRRHKKLFDEHTKDKRAHK